MEGLRSQRSDTVLCFSLVQHSFKIHNGKHLIKDTDKTTLAFTSAEEAQRWHETFKAVIKELAAKAVEVRHQPYFVCMPG